MPRSSTSKKPPDCAAALSDRAAFWHHPFHLARFKREAQVLASLNHPHIAAIYGVEEGPPEASGGAYALVLVLELIEGPTLADRIARGPIPVDETLRIARQIAEALEAAHEHGVVHRDLEPANIKLRPEGTVKVLDFGLAKAREGAGRPLGSSDSPTEVPDVTREGVILGTASYMSPEQARGQSVDKRADVWAFGCVLYEMPTGRRAFGGDNLSDILARVIEREPDFTALPPSTPTTIRTSLRRCLEKDRRRRLPDIGVVRLDIDDAAALTAAALAAPPMGPPAVPSAAPSAALSAARPRRGRPREPGSPGRSRRQRRRSALPSASPRARGGRRVDRRRARSCFSLRLRRGRWSSFRRRRRPRSGRVGPRPIRRTGRPRMGSLSVLTTLTICLGSFPDSVFAQPRVVGSRA